MLWNLPGDWHADKKNNNKIDIYLENFVYLTWWKILMCASNFITYSEFNVKGHC